MKDSTKETDARIIIDDLLRKVGWDPSDKSQVRTEVAIRGSAYEMADEAATYSAKDGDVIPTGRADYILQSTNGRPLALIEAKRSAIHPYTAKQQALPMAKRIGAPFIFLTNGELIYFWDYTNDDARVINSFYSRRDLERLIHLREEKKALATIPIPEYYIRQGEQRLVRPYQQEAMKALDLAFELGKRRFLMELPTGTGKTDLICLYLKRLFESGQAERVLFLVDREQLAKQALEALQDILSHHGSYWLKSGMIRQEQQITVCLLQTMIGRYDDFSSGYFDVVIADECHRSIYGFWQTALTHFDDRWSKWRFKSGTGLRDFVRDEVFPYMSSLVRESPQIAEYFRDAVLEIVDPNVLKQVVDEIDGIDFAKLGTDVKGDIFEYLLTHLGQSALNGQFRTPRQIRMMMVEMVDPDLGDTVYDPACGTGGFLIDSVEYILAKYSSEPQEVPIYGEEWLEKRHQTIGEAKTAMPNLQTYKKGPGEKIPDWGLLENSIYGIDVSRQMMRISMMNLVLHSIRNARVKRANTLSELGGLTDEDLRRKYRVILSNPPFAGVLPRESIRKDLPTNSKKSELLFLGVMMEALAPGGRCAVVVPEGLLFGSTNAHTELRKKLIEDFELLAVVSLPAGVFKPYAGVKTAVLVFRRPTSSRKTENPVVWFYEINNDGYDPD